MAKQSLLLVDADPKNARVLEVSLRKAGYSVTHAGDAEVAFSHADLAPPDLIISDTQLPGVDGFQLLARLRAHPTLREVPFMFLSGDANLDSKRRGLELGVEYLTKPIYLREVITRVALELQRHERKVVELRSSWNSHMAGSLSEMGVVDLLQLIERGEKSGVLHLHSGTDRADIFFREGRVIDAEFERKPFAKRQGANAVYRAMTWNDGLFDMEFAEFDRPATIDEPMQGLLMEGVRRLDEWGRLLEQLPPLTSCFEVDGTALADRLSELPDRINGILRHIDGRHTLQDVVDASGWGELEALETISKLFFEGMIVPVSEELAEDADHADHEAADNSVPSPLSGRPASKDTAPPENASSQRAPTEVPPDTASTETASGQVDAAGAMLLPPGLPGDRRQQPDRRRSPGVLGKKGRRRRRDRRRNRAPETSPSAVALTQEAFPQEAAPQEEARSEASEAKPAPTLESIRPSEEERPRVAEAAPTTDEVPQEEVRGDDAPSEGPGSDGPARNSLAPEEPSGQDAPRSGEGEKSNVIQFPSVGPAARAAGHGEVNEDGTARAVEEMASAEAQEAQEAEPEPEPHPTEHALQEGIDAEQAGTSAEANAESGGDAKAKGEEREPAADTSESSEEPGDEDEDTGEAPAASEQAAAAAEEAQDREDREAGTTGSASTSQEPDTSAGDPIDEEMERFFSTPPAAMAEDDWGDLDPVAGRSEEGSYWKRVSLALGAVAVTLAGGALLFTQCLAHQEDPEVGGATLETPKPLRPVAPVSEEPSSAEETERWAETSPNEQPELPAIEGLGPAASPAPAADEPPAAYLERIAAARTLRGRAAQSAYEEALTLYPRGAEALAGLAFVDLEAGRFREAVERADQAVAIDPTSSKAWVVLGAAHQSLRDSAKAQEAYQSCVEQGVGRYVRDCRMMVR